MIVYIYINNGENKIVTADFHEAYTAAWEDFKKNYPTVVAGYYEGNDEAAFNDFVAKYGWDDYIVEEWDI